MSQEYAQSPAATQQGAAGGFWPEGWWRLMEFRIGVIPLPVYVLTLGVIVYFALWGKLPTEINMAVASAARSQ